jgi:hypothetical protein
MVQLQVTRKATVYDRNKKGAASAGRQHLVEMMQQKLEVDAQ